MVEMEMRVDDEVDPRRVAAKRDEAGADLLAGMIVEGEEAGDAIADPGGGIVLAIRMHPGVEQRGAVRVLDQIGRDRQPDPPLPAFHQVAELALEPTAGQREDLEAHALASAKRRRCNSKS